MPVLLDAECERYFGFDPFWDSDSEISTIELRREISTISLPHRGCSFISKSSIIPVIERLHTRVKSIKGTIATSGARFINELSHNSARYTYRFSRRFCLAKNRARRFLMFD